MPDLLDRLKAALADRYTLQRELGRGGMATVYLAEDLKHERRVAVKVLRPELAAALGAELFLREIRIAAQLHHPHILPLYDSGNTDGFLYYVMPYEEGRSLRERLSREGELPVAEVVRLLRDVVDALAYAHQHGVVHRDIKPENILLAGQHALVADFGVAKAVSEATGRRESTTAGVVLGTPAYMAPEQAAADPHLDHRVDLYAVGVMAYELLTGRPPFVSAMVQQVLAAHLTEAPDPVTRRRPVVPPVLAQLVMRCLEKKPADRPQSAAELLPVLETLAAPSSDGTRTEMQPVRVGWGRLRKRWPLLTAVLLVAAVALAGGRWLLSGAEALRHPRTAIAVLPFQNLSGEGPHSYFANGLHDELLTQLAKVASLKVISRTSVMTYAGSSKTLKEIGGELAVGTVVEGSVQVEGDRLRVTVQLIDAATDEHLWAERYDRTLDDAFAVQSDIAEQIVTAVGATLGGTERAAIAEAPTANAEAYRLYLQGLEYYHRPGRLRENWEVAQQLYERAVELDPGFALGHAALSEMHGRMLWYRYDPSPERVTQNRREAEIALRLAPDLPQAHVAMGLAHYWGQGDYRAAIEEFEIALQRLPNDAQLWASIAAVRRRMGDWDGALAAVEKATQLDPRNADLWVDPAGGTFRRMRRYADAVHAYNRALAIVPDYRVAALEKGLTYVEWTGQLDTLRTVLQAMPPDADLGEASSARLWQTFLLLLERKPEGALQLLRSPPEPVFDGQSFYWPAALWAAWAHQLLRDTATARSDFVHSRILLDSVIGQLPDDWRVHIARGLALAGLGLHDQALYEAGWLERSMVRRQDALLGMEVVRGRALILAQVGEADAALSEIERMLSGPPYVVSVHTLRLDPRWDPIRNDPRFQALLVRYANPRRVR